MTLTVVGVRHHSPACARLVAATIADQRPAYVLIEGPVDMNDRLDELLLGHRLPIAVFTSYRSEGHHHASWSPLCEYSPEWVALSVGRRYGAEVRFIDLPAWHGAFADRTNRYADAEHRYEEITRRLCAEFSVDNVDTLWDHLVENDPGPDLPERLATYFDLVRGDCNPDATPEAGESDRAREAYMAGWIRAALAHAGERPVVVVCGGFHRPSLLRLATSSASEDWPDVPRPEEGGQAASYLVPYSFKRLDSFDGYQSGMPSPEYYQRLWEHGPVQAAAGLLESVVARLRERRQPVSTADLIAARATAGGLASIRGHRHPSRTDLLDSLVSALVNDALDEPLPWTGRGRLAVGTHPAVVEMVAALSGDRVGRLHPETPLPPLVRDVEETLAAHRLDGPGPTTVDLTTELPRSHVLHRLRMLAIPGFTRESGPRAGVEPDLTERWQVLHAEGRLVALIEASAYGPSLASAAAARLNERLAASTGVDELATLLFDAILCGIQDLSTDVLATLHARIGSATDLGALGRALRVFVGLWRHDRLLGAARSATLGAAITASVPRLLWLAEGVHGGPAPAEPPRLAAVAALRDAIVHTGPSLGFGAESALAVMHRVSMDATVPPDLRGAAFGFCWALGRVDDPVRALRGAAGPTTMGDWLAGLFAVAREQVLDAPDLLAVLDTVVAGLSPGDFLIGLPALRQAFTYFPPREREQIAQRVLSRHTGGDAPPLSLRLAADPIELARAYELESHVDTLLRSDGLIV